MKYQLHLAHLYGDLLNTYGDIGNVLVLEYYAKQMDVELTSEVISLDQPFEATKFDIAFFGVAKIMSKSSFLRISKPKNKL